MALVEKELYHDDPSVVIDALRRILPNKKDPHIRKCLLSLLDHPNEIIREVIEKELNLDDKPHLEAIEPPDWMRNLIVNDDIYHYINNIPDEAVHLTFTSPPYFNARDYSYYKSYEEYLDFLTSVFKGVHRITANGRFFVLNTSPVIVPRFNRKYSSRRYGIPFDMHTRLIDIGWEFIDDILWVKPEGAAINRGGNFYQNRKPTAYKPNIVTEYIMVYRKKSKHLIGDVIKLYDEDVIEDSKIEDGYERSNVWNINPSNDSVHSAVFPIELCNRVIKYYSFKGDLIFDPFAGTGAVGRSAYNLNRDFLLVEKNKKYIHRMMELFNDAGIVSHLRYADN